MAQSFTGIDEVVHAVGTQLGETEWLEITQEQVNTFADATGDHQWIHVDTELAAKGPFGATIAHGYLTLSLIPMIGKEIYRVDGLRMGINYGLNKVRFPSPVKVGARVRGVAELIDVSEVPGGMQVSVRYTLEIEGVDKPACVADTVVRLIR
jgi:acyl dehydratase